MYSAVIFDLDGLVLNTEALARDCWRQAISEMGLVIDDREYQRVVGLTIPDIKVVLRDIFGADFPSEDAMRVAYDYYDKRINNGDVAAKEGVYEMLDFLDGVKLPKAVATSSDEAFARRKLGVCDLVERFDVIVGGDNVENGKPAPDIFLAAAKKLKVAPKNCLVFEDSENGVRAGHSAGMAVIMIPDLKQPAKDVEPLAHRVFPSLLEAIPFLQSVIDL